MRTLYRRLAPAGRRASSLLVLAAVAATTMPALAGGLFPLGDRKGVERLSDEPIPYRQVEDLPARPSFPLELGDPFLDTGPLGAGFELPGGAVWQPRLWGFFTYRTALQTFDNGTADRASEWVNRLDVFANLQLTGTEKLIIGMRPLDNNRPGQFTRYAVEPDNRDGFISEFSTTIQTLFFEGDIGSLVPDLDKEGMTPLDFGFAVGRQPLNFQEGILINDTVDAVGLIRNNIVVPGTSNVRVTGIWGWNRLDRNDARSGSDPYMYGLFSSIDAPVSTFNIDAIYVDDDVRPGDAIYIGAAAIQTIGQIGTAFRVNSSHAFDTDIARVGSGTLASAEVSWHPVAADDIVYVNPFIGIDNFTQAGREPILGGPLASLGILFASPNIGNYGSELDPFPKDVVGIATGYQAFWDDHRRNLVLEFAARKAMDNGIDSVGVGFQLQQAIGRRMQFQFEGFVAGQEQGDTRYGSRVELLIQY